MGHRLPEATRAEASGMVGEDVGFPTHLNTDAFTLMIKHGIWAKEWVSSKGVVEIEAKYLANDRFPTFYTLLSGHEDKEAAFRYVIVQAVIHKLTNKRK